MNWTADAVLAIASIVLSLVFGLFPRAKGWFDTLGSDGKPLFMFGLLLAVTVGGLLFTNVSAWPAWSLPVFNWAVIWAQLPQAGLALMAAFGVNQGTYLSLVKPKQREDEYAQRYLFPR